MTEREFDLGDILSITTGRLVSPRHMQGVYDILNFMTDDDLFTHQLPRAGEECAPILLKQHPQLANVSVPDKFGEADVEQWLAEQKAIYGKTLVVKPVGDDQHQRINFIDELCDMVGPDRVVVINTDDPESLKEAMNVLK